MPIWPIPLKNIFSRNTPYVWHFLVVAILCSAIYLPVATASFMKHDDYWFQQYYPTDDCRLNPEYPAMLGIGRIISGEMARCMMFPLYLDYSSIEYFSFLRFFSLLVIILSCSLFSCWFSKVCSKRFWSSIAIALLIFTLPGFQVFVSAAITASIVMGFLFSMMAIWILKDEALSSKDGEGILFRPIWRIALSIFFLFCALNTYQIGGLAFLLPSVALIFFFKARKWVWQRLVITRHLVVFGVSSTMYMLVQKLVIVPIYKSTYPGQAIGDSRKLELATDFYAMLMRLGANTGMSRSLNLWFIKDTHGPASFFACFIALVLFFVLIKCVRRFRCEGSAESRSHFYIEYFVLFSILFCGVQIVAIFHGLNSNYRVILPYTALIALLFIRLVFFCFEHWRTRLARRMLVGILLIFVFTASLMAERNTTKYYSGLAQSEMQFLESGISPLLGSEVTVAHIVRPSSNFEVEGDEFGSLSSRWNNWYGVHGQVQRILMKKNIDLKRIQMSNPSASFVELVDLDAIEREASAVLPGGTCSVNSAKDEANLIRKHGYTLGLERIPGLPGDCELTFSGKEPMMIDMNDMLEALKSS